MRLRQLKSKVVLITYLLFFTKASATLTVLFADSDSLRVYGVVGERAHDDAVVTFGQINTGKG